MHRLAKAYSFWIHLLLLLDDIFVVFAQEDGSSSKLRLWVAEIETGKARPLFQTADIFLNAVFDKYTPYLWIVFEIF